MKKIERKDFLLMGGGAIAGGLTGYVFSGAPFLSYQWLVEWTQDQYVPTKGEENYLMKICQSCPNKCEISVRKIGERAVKVETSNSCCPLGQSMLQLLYHPERIQAPLKLTGPKGSGKFTPVTWEEALTDITAKINGVANGGKADQIAGINNKEINLSSELLERLIKTLGSNNVYAEQSEISIAMKALNGYVEYDFDNTDYILSFGAKILEGWGDSNKITKSFTNWKKNGVKFVQIDTNCTMTTASADEWIAIKPGTESILALGIANYLIKEKRLTSSGKDFSNWSQIVINQYPLSKVSQITGVEIKKIKEIANAFANAKNPVAVAGKGASGVSSSTVEMQAVYCLNTMARTKAATLKAPAGLGNIPVSAKSKEAAGLEDFIKNKDFEVLFVNNANPVYKSVQGNDLAEKMKKAFVVSIMPLINDTGLYSDYILPSITVLEEANADGTTVVGTYGTSKHTGDAIIDIAKKAGQSSQFPWNSFADAVGSAGAVKSANADFTFNIDQLKNHLNDFNKSMGSTEFPMNLMPIELSYVGDGDGMAFPYVNKTIDGKTFSQDKLWVQINRETASKYGVSEGENLEIISERGEIGKVKAHLTDLVAPDVIAIPLGFGQKANTKYAKNKGVNAKEIMSDKIDPATGSIDWWTTRVKIS